MSADELGYFRQHLYEEREACASISHHWKQLFAQLHGHFMELFLAFLQTRLNGSVHHTEFPNHTVAFLIGSGGQTLTFTHVVDLVSHRGKDTDCTRTVQPHVVEHLHHCLRILAAQAVGQIEDSLVGILVQEPRKFLHLHSGYTCEFLCISLHLGEHITESSCRHFVAHHVLIHHGAISHNLRLGQSKLFPETGYACSEIDKISCLCRRVLSQFIHGRSCGQHSTAQSHFFIFAEGHGQFSNLVNGTFAKIIT